MLMGCTRRPFGFPFPVPDSHLLAEPPSTLELLLFIFTSIFPNSRSALLFLGFSYSDALAFVNLLYNVELEDPSSTFSYSLHLSLHLPNSWLSHHDYHGSIVHCWTKVCFMRVSFLAQFFFFVFPRVNNCLIFVCLFLNRLHSKLSPHLPHQASHQSLWETAPWDFFSSCCCLNLAASACGTAAVLRPPWSLSCAGAPLFLVP